MKKRLLLDQCTYIRSKPINIDSGDFHLFENEIVKEISASFVREISYLLLDSNLVIQLPRKRNLPNEVLYNCSTYNYSSNKNLFGRIIKKLVLGKFRINYGTYCWVSDSWSGGYFHWMFDVLPRIFAIHTLCVKHGIILPIDYSRIPYVTDSLSLLGVNKVKFLVADNHYFFNSLIFPTHLAPTGNFNESIVRNLRSYFLEEIADTSLPLKRVFISRSKSTRRKILNEEDVLYILKRFEFELVYCEDLSFRDQIDLFSQTKYLVSNHGAGLSNILFMKEGGKMLELRAEDDSHNNCYFSLASALGLDYYYQLCNKQCSSEDPHTANLYVDLDKLEKNIINLLSA